MWFEMRPVELDFRESAGRIYVTEAVVRAPRPEVWAAFVDPETWRHWFPGVSGASYPGQSAPFGPGTRREATVSGQRYQETVVAWEEQRLWAYRIDRATLPLARAQLECSEFEDAGDGTRVRWTLATDRRLLLWLAAPFFQGTLDRLFQRAARNLEAFLASR
jgi:uncharacterized protein YndB with AHSA1/START domain